MSQIDAIKPRTNVPLDTGHDATAACLADRKIEKLLHFSTWQDGRAKPLELERLSGDGTRVIKGAQHVSACFSDGAGSYQLRLALDERMLANGVGARMRLRGWKHIDYIGIGYTLDGYQHVKAANPISDHWFDFLVGHNDLAWGWGNKWEHPDPREITDIRLYIKGQPKESAFLDVTDMFAWMESETPWEVFAASARPVPPRTMHAVRAYQKKAFRTYETQARQFMETGTCPLNGNINLDWPVSAPQPSALMEAGTYQFAFHAHHPTTMLMLFAHDSGELAPVFAARDQINLWLESSFFKLDPNLKYTWYNHGTAERCMAMVQVYAAGQELGFDIRFMTRLRLAIFRHAQLLASEAFYVSHQPLRYHNHAWFQDMALLSVCVAFPKWRISEYWCDLAIFRLEDQFEKLIIHDSDYAVSIENSINYHDVIQRIVECAGDLVTLSGRETTIPAVSRALSNFSKFFCYPNTLKTISQGDTFRVPNPDKKSDLKVEIPYSAPEVTVLSKAGYGIVKDNHDDTPFMLVMLATSLSRTHKHEDNLSFTLYFDGLEWLIDPSFHSHEYVQPIPAYLKSSPAHNALCLPDRSYTIDPFHAGIEGGLEGDEYRLEGWHDAYEGAYVTRNVTGHVGVLDLRIGDVAKLQDGEDAVGKIMLHCGEGVHAEVSGNTVTLSHPLSEYRLVCEMPDDRIAVKRGVKTGDEIRGITGHTFMKTAEIDTVETTVDLDGEKVWRIRAISK